MEAKVLQLLKEIIVDDSYPDTNNTAIPAPFKDREGIVDSFVIFTSYNEGKKSRNQSKSLKNGLFTQCSISMHSPSSVKASNPNSCRHTSAEVSVSFTKYSDCVKDTNSSAENSYSGTCKRPHVGPNKVAS